MNIKDQNLILLSKTLFWNHLASSRAPFQKKSTDKMKE